MNRREYSVDLTINNTRISRVIIDSHYEEKHSESVNDDIILELVRSLDKKRFEADAIRKPFSYFVTDKITVNHKNYKLIWLLEDDCLYIGVINAYRR